MEKARLIATSMVVALFLFMFASTNTFYGLHQVMAQNENSNESTDSANNIISSNGTLNLSNSTLSLQSETINYHDNAKGYLVYPADVPINNTTTTSPATENKLPAVVMIHEWWGLNDNIKNMANELAKEGYVVLAADLFGEVASTPEEAMPLARSVRENQNESIANLQAAVRYLSSLVNVDSTKIASLGWCLGGGQSLQLALNTEPNNPLASTILYYGTPVSDPEQLSKISWPVLGIFGGEDQSIPVSEVNEFERALNVSGISNEIYIYEGVGHGFANPSGDNFALEETQDSWQKTLSFLDRHLKDKA